MHRTNLAVVVFIIWCAFASGDTVAQVHTDVIHFSNVFPESKGCVLIYGSFEWSLRPTDFLIEQCGLSWKVLKVFDSIGQIDRLRFVSNHTGWGVISGRIAKFKFDGDSFEATTANLKDNNVLVTDVIFLNKSRGWACGLNGLVLKTSDGGKTWGRLHTGVASELHDIGFVDNQFGWILAKPHEQGDNSFRGMLTTRDGGSSWKKVVFKDNQDLDPAYFSSRLHGCGWLTRGEVLCTWDGAHWNSVNVPSEWFGGIYFVNPNTGWMVGDSIMKTVDGGKTWEYSLPEMADSLSLNKVYFADKNRGWAWNELSVYNTSDGGHTWNIISNEWVPLLKKEKKLRKSKPQAQGVL